MTSADLPRQSVDRGVARFGRRDRRDHARSRGERRPVASDGRRSRTWPSRPSTSRPTTGRSTSRTSRQSCSSRTAVRRDRLRVQRDRHDQPGGRHRRDGPRGRRADLRRRRPLRRHTARSTSRRSGRTSSPARSTSSSGRTSACCTAGPRSSNGSRRTRSGRPTIGSRPVPRTSRAIAGARAAVDYIASVGERYGADHLPEYAAFERPSASSSTRRCGRSGPTRWTCSAGCSTAWSESDGIRIWGDRRPRAVGRADADRGVTIAGVTPRAAAEALGRQGITAWDGDFYATGLIERFGLAETGGVLRIGLTHYNTAGEIDRLLAALATIAESAPAAPARLGSAPALRIEQVERRLLPDAAEGCLALARRSWRGAPRTTRIGRRGHPRAASIRSRRYPAAAARHGPAARSGACSVRRRRSPRSPAWLQGTPPPTDRRSIQPAPTRAYPERHGHDHPGLRRPEHDRPPASRSSSSGPARRSGGRSTTRPTASSIRSISTSPGASMTPSPSCSRASGRPSTSSTPRAIRPDLVYQFDPLLVSDGGAIPLRPGKPNRRGEELLTEAWLNAHGRADAGPDRGAGHDRGRRHVLAPARPPVHRPDAPDERRGRPPARRHRPGRRPRLRRPVLAGTGRAHPSPVGDLAGRRRPGGRLPAAAAGRACGSSSASSGSS